jgi:hypothetical protein
MFLAKFAISSRWSSVTRGIEQLPPAARAVVDCKVARERTLIAIGGGDVDEDGLPVDALCRARALYDCEPDEVGDLRFSVGDIITVLAKDDATGWYVYIFDESTQFDNTQVDRSSSRSCGNLSSVLLCSVDQ